MSDTETYKPGQRKGNTKVDYERAAKECESIREAARYLGVSHTTVREQWKRHGIINPFTGKVPS